MTRTQILVAALAVCVLITATVLFLVPWWFWHPLGACSGKSCGYQLWSGIAGSCATSSGLWTGVALLYWKHQCHHHGCIRPSFHNHPGHGHPVCKRHFQEHPDGVIPGKPDPQRET